MKWKFWLDKGGTFTDLIGLNSDGEYIFKKVISGNNDQLEDSGIKAIKEALGLCKESQIPDGIISEVRLGTTIALNTLLEGNGNPVILFCNKGMKDLLKIGDQQRNDLFALNITKQKITPQCVIEVSGRINPKGVEKKKMILNNQLKKDVLQHLGKKNIACAINFMHSYKNPKHEIILKRWLKGLGFKNVICSHEVGFYPRIVPRGQTTLIEASISKPFFDYLESFKKNLGKDVKIGVMGSSGNLIKPDLLKAKDTILSGPAGGMIAANFISKQAGLIDKPIVGIDMGGTSTDVFCIPPNQGEYWERDRETIVRDQKIIAKRLPIHTIAAGGGSIIFQKNERLQVGPNSASSDPGPACYGLNGPLTITDANLILGRIQPEFFPKLFGPSGKDSLDISITEKKFKQLGYGIGYTPEEVAEGALSIAIEKMSEAIKKVSMFRGQDIRNGSLIAYGGASGQLACRIAENLSIGEIFIHPLSSFLSAYGIGIASEGEFRTKIISSFLSSNLLENIQKYRLEEFKKAESTLEKGKDQKEKEIFQKKKYLSYLEIRFKSKDNGLLIEFDEKSTINSLKLNFLSEYKKKFGYIPKQIQDLVVESLEIEVTYIENFKKQSFIQKSENSFLNLPNVELFFRDIGWQNTPCYKSESLQLGNNIFGPALIVDIHNSIVVEPDWVACIDREGILKIKKSQSNQNIKNKLMDKSSFKFDPVLLELYRHRFSSIAEKMGERLRQTSSSVNIRERLDYSCAIFDEKGFLVTNAPHIPVHLGAMSNAIIDLLKQISDGERKKLSPKQTIITNDPFHGGTHLPDITAITPVFAGDKNPIYYVASRGHHSDIGGLTPGSMPPFSETIFDEGLLLRNELFAINGEYDFKKWENYLKKCRNPARNINQLLSDLQAQVNANQLGVIEMEKLAANHGKNNVTNYMRYLQDNASLSFKKIISSIKNSSFKVELDCGAILAVEITVDKLNLIVKLDFTNSSKQRKDNFNAPLAITKAAVLYVFRCLIKDDIPLNDGIFRNIKLVIPKGCILNPSYPAAVVAGNVETSQALCNLLFGALGILSASQGTMNNLTFGTQKNQYYETIAGGSGAGEGFHGADAIQTHMTNSRLTDPEILEQRFNVQLEDFSILKNSGGLGKWRGGNGLLRKIRFLSPMKVSILSGSREIEPFGLFGGSNGSAGENQIELEDGTLININGCETIDIKSNQAIIIKTPGGGGFGKDYNDN